MSSRVLTLLTLMEPEQQQPLCNFPVQAPRDFKIQMPRIFSQPITMSLTSSIWSV